MSGVLMGAGLIVGVCIPILAMKCTAKETIHGDRVEAEYQFVQKAAKAMGRSAKNFRNALHGSSSGFSKNKESFNVSGKFFSKFQKQNV